jgi:EmrB/QacA subfamily drug resistance transporter
MPTRLSSPPVNERWVLVLTSIASLMVALDVLVVSTALSSIRHDLGASIGQLEWTVNAYTLSFAVLLMTGSALGDRFGRRRMFAGGLALFAGASAACALAPDVGLLIAFRVLQGSAAALIAPLSLSILTAATPPQRRGRVFGIYGAITGLAVLGGPVVGGAITQGLSWQWVFWLNVPIGLVAIPFVLVRLPETRGPRERPDFNGLVLITLAVFGVVFGLVRAGGAGWGSPQVVVALAGGLILAAVFVAVERNTREPMLPMRLFAARAFSAGGAAAFLLTCSIFSAVFFMAQFQQIALHQSPLDSGLRLLPWTGTVFFIAPAAGALVDRIGARTLVVGGLATQAAGLIWVALTARAGMPYWHLIAPLVITGIGGSAAIPATQSTAMGAAAPRDIGKASGTFTMLRQLGGAFGVAICVAVFSSAGSDAGAHAFAAGFAPAIAVSGAFSLVGAAVALLLPRGLVEEARAPAVEVAG